MSKPCNWIAPALVAAISGLALSLPASAQSIVLMAGQTAPPGWHGCVDPREAGSGRIRQPEPCELPLVSWPLPVDAAGADPRRSATFQRDPAAAEGVPGGFSRLPWRGYPPHSAPSAFFWR